MHTGKINLSLFIIHSLRKSHRFQALTKGQKFEDVVLIQVLVSYIAVHHDSLRSTAHPVVMDRMETRVMAVGYSKSYIVKQHST